MSKEKKVNPLAQDDGQEANEPQGKEGAEAKPVAAQTATTGQVAAKTPAKTNTDISREKLAQCPQVDCLVPVIPGENPKIPEEVNINGVKFVLKKGVVQKVPLPVAKIIAEKYRIQMEAGHEARIDREKEGLDEALS